MAFNWQSPSLERSPATWLAALTAATLLLSVFLNLWQPATTDDTPSYISASKKGPVAMLDDVRPPGYPILLKAVALVTPDYGLLPTVQILAHVLAAWLLFFALGSYGSPGWQAFALSGGFLLTLVNDPAARCLMTDFPGRTLTAATVALLFRSAAPKPGRWPWVALGIVLALSWLLRPSGIGLLLVAPPVGGLLLLLSRRERPVTLREVWRRTAGVAALSFVPLFAYCGLRLAVVGEFGVSAFSGYQLSGLSVGLLDRAEVLQDAPPDLRPLGLALVEARDAKGLSSVIREGRVDVGLWKREFNVCAWEVAAPVAERMFGPSPTTAGDRLAVLSKWALRRHARAYGSFVVANLGECLGGLLRYGLVLQALLVAGFLLFAVRLWTCALRASDPGGPRVPDSGVREGFLVFALAFALVAVILTALAAVNLGRYSIAAGILLPSCAAEWCYCEGTKIGRALRPGGGGA
jgi:hypothetical protein